MSSNLESAPIMATLDYANSSLDSSCASQYFHEQLHNDNGFFYTLPTLEEDWQQVSLTFISYILSNQLIHVLISLIMFSIRYNIEGL